MEKNIITQYFEEIETTREYNGYFCSVAEAITIVILGSICGLKNISQIHQWATSDRISGFLKEKFGIENIPCYYWLLCLLKLIKPESLNHCFARWVEAVLPEKRNGMTIALDGKTIRSTGHMNRYESPLHIVSAQVSELGITFAQKSVNGKSNEVFEIVGCMVVADAWNCQKKTAKAVIAGHADYLLCAKDNQESLKKDIEDYVQDKTFQKKMEKTVRTEKSRNRIEKRTAFVTDDIGWLRGREDWECLKCIGAVHTEFEVKCERSSEWHSYISSHRLSAEELLYYARGE